MLCGWAEEVTELFRFVESQLYVAYFAIMHGLSICWLFVSRTILSDSTAFQLLKDVICQSSDWAFTSQWQCTSVVCTSAQWGGLQLGVFVRTSGCASQLCTSCSITEPLCHCIHDHTSSIVVAFSAQLSRKTAICKARFQSYSDCFSDLQQQLESSLQRAMDLVTVRGASNWLCNPVHLFIYGVFSRTPPTMDLMRAESRLS